MELYGLGPCKILQFLNKSQRPMYGKRWVLKFSPTWEVEGELDLLIRESAPPLGKRVRRGEVHARSSSSSAARSLASSRHDTRRVS